MNHRRRTFQKQGLEVAERQRPTRNGHGPPRGRLKCASPFDRRAFVTQICKSRGSSANRLVTKSLFAQSPSVAIRRVARKNQHHDIHHARAQDRRRIIRRLQQIVVGSCQVFQLPGLAGGQSAKASPARPWAVVADRAAGNAELDGRRRPGVADLAYLVSERRRRSRGPSTPARPTWTAQDTIQQTPTSAAGQTAQANLYDWIVQFNTASLAGISSVAQTASLLVGGGVDFEAI